MGLFDRSGSKLSGRTALLLPADPGDALLDAARVYDPQVRPWNGRLIFRNGILLFGPLAVTSKLEQQAGLPAGMAVAYYTGAAGHTSRGHEAKHFDGDRLVRGLADRLGGTVKYAGPPIAEAVARGSQVSKIIYATGLRAGRRAASRARSREGTGRTGSVTSGSPAAPRSARFRLRRRAGTRR